MCRLRRARRKTPGCNGPISVRDPQAAETDARNLKAALAEAKAEEAFLSAASPGPGRATQLMPAARNRPT